MTQGIPYERHWLLWPTDAGRQAALQSAQSLVPGAPPSSVRALILSDIPAVVRRQTPQCPKGAVQVGFASPGRTAGVRLRVGAQIPLAAVARWQDPFYLYADKVAALPMEPFVRQVLRAGEETGFSVGFYGSAAMQMATGLPYLHPGSDVDICVRGARRGIAGAEAFARRLRRLEAAFSLRADVELDYQGYGVKLAELLSQSRTVLGKGLYGAALFEKRGDALVRWDETPPGVERTAGGAMEADCAKIAAAAERALRFEAAATPKPGLVDAANSGAHRDMDIETFYASAAALAPYFEEMACQGAGFAGGPEELLAAVRPAGQRAEAAMLEATGGVNTHKGAIFSLGILCAAAGYAQGHGLPATAEALLVLCGQIAAKTPLELAADKEPATHGEEAFARAGFTGVRGQAAAAYPDVRLRGYPVLKERLAMGDSLNDAAVVCLLHLIAHVDDTNMLRRGGHTTLREVQRRMRRDLAGAGAEDTPALIRLASAWDAFFIRHNLSPGGSADLLALALMLHFLENGQNTTYSTSLRKDGLPGSGRLAKHRRKRDSE